MTAAGDLLWVPAPERVKTARMTAYMEWLERRLDHRFEDYAGLHSWSVNELDAFWRSIWDFFEIRSSGSFERALGSTAMPGATWFDGAQISLVEHVFRSARTDRPAILARSETSGRREVSWAELRASVVAVAVWLRREGVQPGDRVVGYLPNTPEAVIACL